MRRVLLISLSLVVALVGWSAVCADDGFYVIPTMKGNYAPVPKTGEMANTIEGSDGNLQKGVVWPTPRFTDNNNGTVTDNLTKLVWMKNANALGTKTWHDALTAANNLKSGDPGTGLADGSRAGDWRLPNIRELQSLVDYGRHSPALPAVNTFTNVQSSYYWSSSTNAPNTTFAWFVLFSDGYAFYHSKFIFNYVWCVRAGP